jgi:hypothetical protein
MPEDNRVPAEADIVLPETSGPEQILQALTRDFANRPDACRHSSEALVFTALARMRETRTDKSPTQLIISSRLQRWKIRCWHWYR